MWIAEGLKKLAEVFPVPLYVVGGAVRDALLQRTPYDFDIAAPLAPEKALECLNNAGYKAQAESAKFGTLVISDGDNKYEYTAFRSDSYDGTGGHAPTAVAFTEDIYKDALRRDFTVNALYYDIKADEYLDPLGRGMEDLREGRICATRTPEEVFSEDGLRILRMVRIAAECGFKIEEGTFNAARNLAYCLQDISAYRKRDEFSKMLVADTKYGIKNAHVEAIKLLVSSDAAVYVIPEITEGICCKQRPDFHAYDVYGHILKVLELVPPRLRLAALFHDIAKPQVKRATGRSLGHAEAGAQIAVIRLKELGFSKDEIKRTAMLVSSHMFDLYCGLPEKEVRLFIQNHFDLIPDLLILKNADHVGGGVLKGESPSAVRLRELREQMLAEGVPMTIKDLKVKGEDLLDIPEEQRGIILKKLLAECVCGGEILNREKQLEFLKYAKENSEVNKNEQ